MAELHFTGNNQSITSYDVEPHIFKNVYIQVGLALLYLVIFGLSFFGNMAVTLVVSCYWKTKSVANFWLGNLAVANLAVSLFSIFQNLTLHLLDKWIFGELMCRMYHLITSLWQGASILLHVFISLERYIFYLHPTRHSRIFTRQKLFLITLGVWLTSAIISFPSFLSFGLERIQLNEKGDVVGEICVPMKSMFTSATADRIYFLLIYFIPLVLVMATYVRVGLFLRAIEIRRMELDKQNPRVQCELLLASKLRPSPKDGAIILRRVQSAPNDLDSVFNPASSSPGLNSRGRILPKKAATNLEAGKAKRSRKRDGQHLRCVPTIVLTPPSDDIRPGSSTEYGVGRPACDERPVLSRQKVLSRKKFEGRRRYDAEGRGESSRSSHSPTACTTSFSSNLPKRTRTAQRLAAPRKLHRLNRQRLSCIRCKPRQRSLWMLILIFLSFAVLSFPHHACKIWLDSASLNGTRNDVELVIAPLTFALMHASCAVNPIIHYAFMSKYFRAGLNHCWSHCKV